MRIVLATSRQWNEWMVPLLRETTGHEVFLISLKEDLTLENLNKLKPDYIFFPHWSYIIKPEIFTSFECVIFHMTDLPFGRGGSPLQNLISRGIYKTVISAIKCVEELDAGPIFLKHPLDLSGSAQEIFERASQITYQMIQEILSQKMVPYEQSGKAVSFIRRTPQESDISKSNTLNSVYDYIRMLDADGYPHAFIENENLRFEFRDASWDGNEVVASVRIRRK